VTAIVAYGAISALGEGEAAFRVAAPGEVPRVAVARDAALAQAGLTRPYLARAPLADDPLVDRGLLLVERAAAACLAMLDATLPGFRAQKLGLAIGTSSGGLRASEALFDDASSPRGLHAAGRGEHTYFRGLSRVAAQVAAGPVRGALVLGACASSTIAIGLGCAWLADGSCDLVLAGGYDAVGTFVAAGFEAIRATSVSGVMRPFRAGRDGLVLGEGAGLVALVRGRNPRAFGYVRGFGVASDAVHLTAPDRTGAGLARAAQAALAGAPGLTVDLVSAHATATDYNDAAESRAIVAALGEGSRAVVHAFKPQIGHTLGAAGVLESLAALDAMARGVLPATAEALPSPPGEPPLANVRSESGAGEPVVALKLSAAFGGANAALLLTKDAGEDAPVPPRAVFVSAAVHTSEEPPLAELEALTGVPRDKLGRTDRLSRFALGAVGALRSRLGSLEGAGIVVGHGLATHETNALFWAGARRRGAALAEPRRFPFTSPNAPAGECSIAFRLTGPGLAVGVGQAGGLEALSVATDLVRAGVADRIVVVACDDVGPASAPFMAGPSGAVALLVSADPAGDAVAEVVSAEVEVGHGSGDPDGLLTPAHVALLPLVGGRPGVLETGPSWGIFARVRLRPLDRAPATR